MPQTLLGAGNTTENEAGIISIITEPTKHAKIVKAVFCPVA